MEIDSTETNSGPQDARNEFSGREAMYKFVLNRYQEFYGLCLDNPHNLDVMYVEIPNTAKEMEFIASRLRPPGITDEEFSDELDRMSKSRYFVCPAEKAAIGTGGDGSEGDPFVCHIGENKDDHAAFVARYITQFDEDFYLLKQVKRNNETKQQLFLITAFGDVIEQD